MTDILELAKTLGSDYKYGKKFKGKDEFMNEQMKNCKKKDLSKVKETKKERGKQIKNCRIKNV